MSSIPASRHGRIVGGMMTLLVFVLSGTLVAAEGVAGPPPADLIVWNRTIVTFRVGVGLQASVSPSERARLASARIAQLPEAILDRPIDVKPASMPGLDGVILSLDGHPLFAIATADIDPDSQQTVEVVASIAAAHMRNALDARIAQSKPYVVLIGLVLDLGFTLALFLCLFLVFRLRRRLTAQIERVRFTRAPTIGGIDIMPAVRAFLRVCSSLVVWMLCAGLAYGWLTSVLAVFPYTKPWSLALGSFLVSLLADLGNALARSLPQVFMVAVILILTRGLVRLMSAFFASVEEGRLEVAWLDSDTASATRRIASVLAWLLAITVAYPHIPGSNTAAFQGLSVMVGVMISLSSAGLINQVMSGMVIIYSRSMRLGDLVTASEVTGMVTSIGVLSTKIRTLKDEEITIPNAAMVANKVVNYSRLVGSTGMMISTTVTIGYDVPWRQIHALLLVAAERTPTVRKDSKPFVLQRALSDFYVEYELRCRIDDPRAQGIVLSELHGHIQDTFNEHGVQIMSPHFEAQPAGQIGVPRERWFAEPAVPTDSPRALRIQAGGANQG